MPSLLPDDHSLELFERFSDPDQNAEEYARLSALQGEDLAAAIQFDLPEGYELREVKEPNSETELYIVLLNHNAKRVAYYNCVEKVDWHLDQVSQEKPVRQVMIWRARYGDDNRISRDLVQAVFFKRLVNQYNIVVSDSEQTREGRGMWQDLLYTAMDSEKHIAATADTQSLHVNLITNEKQLNQQFKWLWGDQNFHKDRLGVVAEK